MKIILCKSHFDGPISGADETLVTYAAQLRKAGQSVSVLLMYLHAEEDQYYQRLLEADVPVSWIASNLTQTSFGAGRKLANRMFYTFPASKSFVRRKTQPMLSTLAGRYARECRRFFETEQPDLVHVMTPNAGAAVMIKAAHDAGVPVIYQELGIPYHPPGFDYYHQFASLLPLCSEIAALSPLLMEHCRDELSPQKGLSVLPIMSQELVNGHERKHNDGKVTFGFAARMEELKGPLVLIDALSIACRGNDRIYLNLAGDGSQRQKIAARAKSFNIAGRYRYHGVYTHPEERRSFMESIDVFIMPSFTEGTPNSIVEAMAHRKPIIASQVGGVADMIGDDAGILVAPGDANGLAEAMRRLANDPELRRRMGQIAYERYQRFFSPSVVVPLMLDTYRRLSGNGPRQIEGEVDLHPWALARN